MSDFKIKPATIVSPDTSETLIPPTDFRSSFFRLLEHKGIFLNHQQIEIISGTAQHCIIDSVPGSGKTACIASTAGYLKMVEMVTDNEILLLTFTKKASNEMKDRITQIIPEHQITVSTIHSLCYKLLRSNGFKEYSVLDETHQKAIVRSILKEHNLQKIYQPESIIEISQYNINSMTECYETEINSIITQYADFKRQNKLIDFTDLLQEAYLLIQDNSRLRRLLQDRFKYILIDEYQDLNMLQYHILKLLCDDNTVLLAFGDRNQGIFSFAAAVPDISQLFKNDFPDISAFSLDINYRSSAEICGLAATIINKPMYAVKSNNTCPVILSTADAIDEAKFIADKIQQEVSARKRNYNDFCILYRSGAVVGAVLSELLLREIPFRSFAPIETIYENKMAATLISHLKMAVNLNDTEAFLDIAGTMYLSKVKTAHYLNKQNIGGKLNLFELMLDHPGLEQYQYEILNSRMELMKQMADITPVMALDSLLSDNVIERCLKGSNVSSEVADELLEDVIGQLITAANQFSTIEDFLLNVDEVLSRNKEQEKNGSEVDAVNLMTIHGSKGLQWPVVFIIHCVEGIIPHRHVIDIGTELSAGYRNSANLGGSIEEERRLLYVGITRAKDELIITVPQNHNNRATEISRFLKEVKL